MRVETITAPDGVAFVRLPILALKVILWPRERYVLLWRGQRVGAGRLTRC